jgi:hypothetical protein
MGTQALPRNLVRSTTYTKGLYFPFSDSTNYFASSVMGSARKQESTKNILSPSLQSSTLALQPLRTQKRGTNGISASNPEIIQNRFPTRHMCHQEEVQHLGMWKSYSTSSSVTGRHVES